MEEKVNAIHQKIMEITEGKTNEAQKKLDSVTKKWEKTRSTITQLQVAIKTAERNAKKASERIENMKSELEEAEKREKEIEEEKKTLIADCKLSAERAAALKVRVTTVYSSTPMCRTFLNKGFFFCIFGYFRKK